MTCQELADFLLEYCAGELPPEECAIFERHLADCPNCDEYLRQYRDTVTAGQRAFERMEDDAPCDVPETLVQAILAARRR